MPYTLVIVESPSKAKTIGKFLGKNYKVIASAGHVRDIPRSSLGIDIEHGFEPRYITIRGRGEILDGIRRLARRADKVLLATDPDREGEAISWHLASILKIDPTTPCRVEFNEITSATVKKAIKTPRAIDKDLFNEQQARRVLDRLIGYQITDIIWKKLARRLSAGRVQSAATKLICDREREIESFVPEEYWNITAVLQSNEKNKTFRARFCLPGDKHVSNEEEANAVVSKTGSAQFAVTSVKEEEKIRKALPPFTTSSLQQEASRKLNFTTKRTMQVAQTLYEGVELGKKGPVGLISYMRTDSTRISEEAQAAALKAIGERYGEAYIPATPNVYKGRANAQDAHEAIRPTDIANTPDSVKEFLSKEQLKLYKLIYDRFLASQMTDMRYVSITVMFDANGCSYRSTGSRTLFDGFTKVYTEGTDTITEKEDKLPSLKTGDKLTAESIAAEQRYTQGPERYTEASLVRAMEENGIGRPSTYAPTISTIIERGYITRERKTLFLTDLGKIVTDWMSENFPDIVDIEFTAGMESQLDDIGEGKRDWHEMVSTFYGPFNDCLEEAQQREPVRIPNRESDVICEKCGAHMIYKTGRYGEFLACPNYPECSNTKTIIKRIGVSCPKCGGDMIEKKSRKGRTFYGCINYPECDFGVYNRPVNKFCPTCGSILTEVYGGTLLRCSNEKCGYSERAEKRGENTNA